MNGPFFLKKIPRGQGPGVVEGKEKMVVVAVKNDNKVKLEDWRYPYLMALAVLGT